jgi:hypothetical protein
MNLNPKARFLQDNAAVQRHATLFASTEMQQYLELALTEYCLNLPPSRGAGEALDANSRRDGAIGYISTLLNLSSKATPMVRASDNLPHLP